MKMTYFGAVWSPRAFASMLKMLASTPGYQTWKLVANLASATEPSTVPSGLGRMATGLENLES